MSDISPGTGQPARPGADGTSPITTEDWQSWYEASCLDRRSRTEAKSGAGPGRLPRWRRVATVVTGAAGVLAVFSAGVLYADVHSPHETAAAGTPYLAPAPLPVRSAPAPPAPAATVIVQAPSNVPVVTRSAGAVRGAPPPQISIPALKINQRLIGLRVNANRQLEVPQNYNDIGWWNTGPVAGDPGAAVIVGHVDSTVGPAVFYRLSSLTRGATIGVERADGTTVKFTVTRLQAFSKRHFPDKLVYRTSGKPSLHLVTCGGRYDRATGYRDNVVVFADMVQPPHTTKPRTVQPKAPVRAHAKPTSRTLSSAKAHQTKAGAHHTSAVAS